jgi:hypothetical protein
MEAGDFLVIFQDEQMEHFKPGDRIDQATFDSSLTTEQKSSS